MNLLGSVAIISAIIVVSFISLNTSTSFRFAQLSFSINLIYVPDHFV